jgi:hypothetical protein
MEFFHRRSRHLKLAVSMYLCDICIWLENPTAANSALVLSDYLTEVMQTPTRPLIAYHHKSRQATCSEDRAEDASIDQ